MSDATKHNDAEPKTADASAQDDDAPKAPVTAAVWFEHHIHLTPEHADASGIELVRQANVRFQRGDLLGTRETLAPLLDPAKASDASQEARDAAARLAAATRPDPLTLGVVGACAAFFIIILTQVY